MLSIYDGHCDPSSSSVTKYSKTHAAILKAPIMQRKIDAATTVKIFAFKIKPVIIIDRKSNFLGCGRHCCIYIY